MAQDHGPSIKYEEAYEAPCEEGLSKVEALRDR